LKVSSRDIGYGGMKDAHAITRQIFSIQGTTPEKVMGAFLTGMTVQWAARHGNKLRLGHLAGNRFAIKIREVNPTDVVKLKPVLELIEKHGLPNFFGEQRFGRRQTNDQLGAALIRSDNEAVLRLLLGGADSNQRTAEARAAFDLRDNAAAMQLWPRTGGMERRVLARLMKTHRPAAAVHAIDEKVRRLWISALQSRIFNDVLARRIDSIDRLIDGDVAYKHENGACFPVPVAEVEQARCTAFEISPTGPLVGYRMTWPDGQPREMEQAALAAVELKPEDFRQSGKLRIKGARRPLRVKPKDVELAGGVDEFGPHITVAFTLPSGAFATVLLREIMKTPAQSEEALG
jgi:tRNA pseudouridine13 synthase